MDIDSGHSFRTSPKNVAVERDFNRVDIEGRSPDAIEQALAPFEGEAVQAIRNAIATRAFPGDEDWNSILNLLGLIAVRNPQLRRSFNQSREAVLHRMNDMLVSDPRIWERMVRKAQEAGHISADVPSFEHMKRFVEERQYEIEFTAEGNLRVEFNAFNTLLPLLGQRSWSLFLAADDGPEFICSDHPVALDWKNGRSGPVGYGLKETEVFFPLGRTAGFYGTFENPLRPVIDLKPEQIATMNRRVALNADRHVFSAKDSFVMWHEGKVREVKLLPNGRKGLKR